MKKFFIYFSIFLFGTSLFAAPKMYISEKDVSLKSSTSFFASKIGSLKYGDQVTVLETNGKWSKIQSINTPDLSGWVSSSQLTKRKIMASNNYFSADTSELALAGKGFSSSKSKRKVKSNFDSIKIIEEVNLTEEELLEFIKEGNLKNE